MSLESIKEMLKTVHFYNTVNITQTFSKGEDSIITARCIKNTNILEITFYEEQKVEQFTCIEKAAAAIDRAINSHQYSINS